MVALVTGASAGFGEAICRRLVAEGHRVIGAARRLEKLTQLQEELGFENFLSASNGCVGYKKCGSGLRTFARDLAND